MVAFSCRSARYKRTKNTNMMINIRHTDVASPVPTGYMSNSDNDPSSDANLALMELEKGLRSLKIGEQCEAIVKLSTILERFPFPLLVNSAFLKLADVFRTGSNFLKLCVLKSIQSCRKHLDKIFNVDEFYRRFFAVIHSNDPIARAVTLRVFGNISSIVADRKNIHNCIRTGLDSHDSAEVEAAIFATKCFAEQSSDFAGSIWQTVAEMIKGLQTPIDTKLKLIPVLKYMYHDISISRQIFTLCKELLSSYPSYRFAMMILNTSTQLAVSTLINIPQQIEVLLHYSTNDARKSINLIAVNNLYILAKSAPHLWSAEHVKNLILVALNTLHENMKRKILAVLSILSESPNCSCIFTEEVLTHMESLCNDMSLEISASATKVKIQVVTSVNDKIEESFLSALESDLQMMFALVLSEHSMSALKKCLSATEILLRKVKKGISLIPFICECLSNMESDCLLEVLHTLVTMSTQIDELCADHVTVFTNLLSNRVTTCTGKQDKDILVALVTLTFQASTNILSNEKQELEERLLHDMITLSSDERFWLLYRVSRQASRLGFAKLSSKLFNLLTSKVSSESLFFWLNSQKCFQEGEAILMDDFESVMKLQEVLMTSHNHYQDGLTNLKAAITTDHPLYFQFKYARLRADLLRGYSQLLTCCSGLKLNPPPVAASKQCMSTGQDPYQFSRIALQFQNCVSIFNNVAIGYQNLYKISFNADRVSLNVIKGLQESCQLMVFAINSLLSFHNKDRPVHTHEAEEISEPRVSNQFLRHITKTNLMILDRLQTNDSCGQVSIDQAECLTNIIVSQLKVPFTYPLFFFKRQQNTYIQLSVSPATPIVEEPYTLYITHQMTVKVEGVILNSSEEVKFRRPSQVRVSLKMRPADDVRNPANQHKPVQPTELILKEATTPRHDYFSAEFLVPFKYVGRHTLKITSGITDEHGIEWETGPSYLIHVDAQEHGGHYARKK